MRIRWTEPAVQDFTRICDYLEERGGAPVARRGALAIFGGITSLRDFPRRGRPGRKAGTRELVFTRLPYVVVYRLSHEVVEILRIFHGAQNWP
jgi:toxin ParE1/3/4